MHRARLRHPIVHRRWRSRTSIGASHPALGGSKRSGIRPASMAGDRLGERSGNIGVHRRHATPGLRRHAQAVRQLGAGEPITVPLVDARPT